MSPGLYIIEVRKKDYEKVKLEIELPAGQKDVHIDMVKENPLNLKVIVADSVSFGFIENAKIQVLLLITN